LAILVSLPFHINFRIILSVSSKTLTGGKMVFLINGTGTTGHTYAKNNNNNPQPVSYLIQKLTEYGS